MATFYSDTITVGTYTRARIVVKETDINHITNKTKGEVYVQMWRTNTGYTTYGEGTLYLKMSGETDWTTSNITTSQTLTYNSYTQVGSKKSFTLTHEPNGTLSATFYAKTVTNNHNITFDTQSFKVTFTKTDRDAPTITHSVSSLSSSGFKISISASATCDVFQYSIDGGSTYTTCSTTAGTSASVTLSGLSSDTYSVRTRARKDKNELYGYSAKSSVDIVPPTVTHSVSNITASSFVVSISASTTCNLFQYSIDGGSTYTTCSTTAGTSAKVTVSDLSPNTSYTVRVRARKKSNSLYGYSVKGTAKTLGASLLTSTGSFIVDDEAPTISLTSSVYSSAYYHKVFLQVGTTKLEIGTFKASASGTVKKTFTLSSSVKTKVLADMSTVKTKKFDLFLYTYSDSAYSKQIGSAGKSSYTAITTSANSSPTFTGFSYKENNTKLTEIIGDSKILVQSLSQLLVTCKKGVAKNEADIKSYSATIGNVTVSSSSTSLLIDKIDVAGELTLTVTCTDSRGYSTRKTATVTVIEYEKPKISKFTVKRKNDVEAIVGFTISASVSPVKVNGVQKNFPTNAVYRYKNVTEDSSYKSPVSIFKSSKVSGASYSDKIDDLGVSFDTESSFAFYFYMYDTITSALNGGSYATRSKSTPLAAAQPLISMRKKNSAHDFRRIGINNNSPEFAVDVGAKNVLDAFGINNQSVFDYIYPVGSVYVAKSPDTRPASLFGGTWKLVDKGYKSFYTYSDDDTYLSLVNASSSTIRVNRGGNTINLSCSFITSVELTDSSFTIASLDLDKIGIKDFAISTWFLGYSDGGNSALFLKIDYDNGDILCVDTVPDHSVPVGSSLNFVVSVTIPFGSMVDDCCDKFYWQRTAL